MSEALIRGFVDVLWPVSWRPGMASTDGGEPFLTLSAADFKKKTGLRSYHFRLSDPELEITAEHLDGQGLNVYHSVALHGADLGHSRGTKKDVLWFPGLFVDVDLAGPGHAATNLPPSIEVFAAEVLAKFDFEPSIAVATGGGAHLYFLLDQPLAVTDANRGEVEKISKEFQGRIIALAKAAGFHVDVTADLTRILRPVGTHNQKISGDPRPVEWLYPPDGCVRYSWEALSAKGKAVATSAPPPPPETTLALRTAAATPTAPVASPSPVTSRLKPDRAALDALLARHRTSAPVGVPPAPAVAPGEYTNRPGINQGPLVTLTGKDVWEGMPGAFQLEDGTWLKQIQPPADQIAARVLDIVEACPTLVVHTQGFFRMRGRNLVDINDAEGFQADITASCVTLMAGKEPVPAVFETAAKVVKAKPRPALDIRPIRWEGETNASGELLLALHEIPSPVEGDWSAFKEFIDRTSCPETVKRWIWTCFLPEEQTGREALVLVGAGNDGKSEFVRSLIDFMGPAAGTSEIIKAEDKFSLAALVRKRVVSFGDVRNPRPLHGRIMRELVAGATLPYQRKGVDLQQARFHPRIVITSNEQFQIDPNNSAEFSRVRRVNVAPLVGNAGDRGWIKRLAAQWAAFLWECRAEYERSCTPGQDIPITEACRAALAGGIEAIAEEFDYLSVRLDFTRQEADFITALEFVTLLEDARYTNYKRKDAYTWFKSQGVVERNVRVKGKKCRVWTGVKQLTQQVTHKEIFAARSDLRSVPADATPPQGTA